jgi:predicted alpha/beta superfamily hydrolase
MAFIQDNSAFSKRMPPVIVVNINHGNMEFAKVEPLRNRDFRPTAVKERPGSGGAGAFLDFFEKELIPFVDRTYRTDITDRGLLGHSAGGVFAIYAMEERPALFQRIVAASVAFGTFSNELFSAEKLNNFKSPVRLDLSAGEEEDSPERRNFYELLNKVKPPNLEYRYTVYKGENHNSVRLSSFPLGLYWVYQSHVSRSQP